MYRDIILQTDACGRIRKLQFDRPHAERKKETERLVDIDSLWTPASQLESLFLNAKQGVAVYEYGKEQIEIIRVNNAYYEVFGYQDISQKKDIFREFQNDIINVFWMPFFIQQIKDVKHNVNFPGRMKQEKKFLYH